MTYYTYYPSNVYLAHHGIKGQKWGIRRFQNPDGSLTAEGKKRYGVESVSYNQNNNLRKHITGDYAGVAGMLLNPNYARSRREDRLKRRTEKLKTDIESGKSKNVEKDKKTLENKQRRYDIQKSINVSREKYEAALTNGQQALRNWLPGIGSMLKYNDIMKQEGYSKGQRFLREAALFVPYANIASIVVTKSDIIKKHGGKDFVDYFNTRIG